MSETLSNVLVLFGIVGAWFLLRWIFTLSWAQRSEKILEYETDDRRLKRTKREVGFVRDINDTNGGRNGSVGFFRLLIEMRNGDELEAFCSENDWKIATWMNRELVVEYDPSDLENNEIVGGFSPTDVTELSDEQIHELVQKTQIQVDRLNDIGTPAFAVVTEIVASKTLINRNGIMTFLTVVVMPEDGENFVAGFSAALDLKRFGNYQPGGNIWVRFNPEDNSEVSLDSDRQKGDIYKTKNA